MLSNLRKLTVNHKKIHILHINDICCSKMRASLQTLKPYVSLGRNYSSPPGLIGNDIKSLHSVISPPIAKIRNIGIMAHIDAGKTTTTERILYYSGYTRSLGDVDDGDTVTDFMAQERERGITIQSAAVTFDWKGYRINLIDTPGHVDFTLEVERCLRVLDGAVAVFDASAGVEAQTLTVWRQADKHRIPRICFLNKMDKTGASFKYAVESIREKLKAKPLLLQLPLGEGKAFKGVVDVVSKEKLLWNPNSDDGKDFLRKPLLEMSDPELLKETTEARNALIEQVADLDDEFADLVLGEFSENFDLLPAEQVNFIYFLINLSFSLILVIFSSSLNQTVLCGMGELHIEIVHDRIKREYGLETYLGPLQVAYRETILNAVCATDTLDRTLGDKRHLVTIELEVKPTGTASVVPVIEYAGSVLEDLPKASQEAIENGIHSACLQGPLLGSPIQDVAVTVHSLIIHPGTSTTMISACVSRCVQKALKKADKQVLEPLMNLEVTVTGDYLSPVLADLAQRRGTIQEIQTRQENKIIIGFVPLAEIMGYSTVLRTLTSGSATFALELSNYQAMNPQDQTTLLSRRSGLTQVL
ncbi:ribosome-releasing factor 2, mitochondrial [Suricata suricatta]|uniref:ribosome-releasing factor 2, mitochondrial n=1 Tax=Suricata suricatta TaxID=37032 RepID=UPI001155F607|nr:ribosome-releasing factor 2, mitochondrial [Suricata suricatta]